MMKIKNQILYRRIKNIPYLWEDVDYLGGHIILHSIP